MRLVDLTRICNSVKGVGERSNWDWCVGCAAQRLSSQAPAVPSQMLAGHSLVDKGHISRIEPISDGIERRDSDASFRLSAAETAHSQGTVSTLLVGHQNAQAQEVQEGSAPADDANTRQTDIAFVRLASRGPAHLYLTFFLMSLLGVAPRAISLLILNANSPALPEGLGAAPATGSAVSSPSDGVAESFRETWSVCKQQGQVWTALNSAGTFYTTMVMTDHFFIYSSIMVCWIGSMHVLFRNSDRGAQLLALLSSAFQVLLFLVSIGLVMWLLLSNPSPASIASIHQVLPWNLRLSAAIFFLPTLAISTRSVYLEKGKITVRGLGRKWRFLPIITLVLLFSITIVDVDNLVSALSGGHPVTQSAFRLAGLIITCKSLLIALRRATFYDKARLYVLMCLVAYLSTRLGVFVCVHTRACFSFSLSLSLSAFPHPLSLSLPLPPSLFSLSLARTQPRPDSGSHQCMVYSPSHKRM